MSILAVNRLQAKRRSARASRSTSLCGWTDKIVRSAPSCCCLPEQPGLNRHGAALQVGRELLVGSTLSVRHWRGGIKIPARVVAQVSAGQGSFTYGIEFLDSDGTRDFWGIAFPSVESKATAAHLAEQSGIARRRSAIPSHQS